MAPLDAPSRRVLGPLMAMFNLVKVAIPLGLGIMSAAILHHYVLSDRGTAHAAVPSSRQSGMKPKIARSPAYSPVLFDNSIDPRLIMPPLFYR